jgi:hypothetical protein
MSRGGSFPNLLADNPWINRGGFAPSPETFFGYGEQARTLRSSER